MHQGSFRLLIHTTCSLVLALVLGSSTASALTPPAYPGSVHDRAKRIFERVVGVPPSAAQLTSMVGLIEAGNISDAVNVALADPSFYRIGLKRLVTPWTNVDHDPDAVLNDFSATIIGMVRDDKDFRRVLYGNEYYVRPEATLITGNVIANPQAVVAPPPPPVDVNARTLEFRLNNGNCTGTYVTQQPAPMENAPNNFCRVTFVFGAGPLSLQEVVDQINAAAPGGASISGGNRLQLTDSRGVEISGGNILGSLGLSVSPRSWFAGDNDHYLDLEQRDLDLTLIENLKEVSQTDYVLNDNRVRRNRGNGFANAELIASAANPAPAGVMTTRGAAAAFYNMGTNRRMVKFTLENFMCKRLEELKDFTLSDHKVRRDVSRSPGGNSAEYATYCKGCHNVMDGLANAFANLDYRANDRLRFEVVSGGDRTDSGNKNNRNATVFPAGAGVFNDSWDNNLVNGSNASKMGWRGNAQSGMGAETLGETLANSEQFSRCQVSQVFKHVCKRDPSASEQSAVAAIVSAFESEGYNLKTIFRRVAAVCIQ